MTSRLITVLSAFTGAWGKPGGGICAAEHNGGPFVDAKRVTRPNFRKVSGPGVNINCLGSALTAEGEDAVKAFSSMEAILWALCVIRRRFLRG